MKGTPATSSSARLDIFPGTPNRLLAAIGVMSALCLWTFFMDDGASLPTALSLVAAGGLLTIMLSYGTSSSTRFAPPVLVALLALPPFLRDGIAVAGGTYQNRYLSGLPVIEQRALLSTALILTVASLAAYMAGYVTVRPGTEGLTGRAVQHLRAVHRPDVAWVIAAVLGLIGFALLFRVAGGNLFAFLEDRSRAQEGGVTYVRYLATWLQFAPPLALEAWRRRGAQRVPWLALGLLLLVIGLSIPLGGRGRVVNTVLMLLIFSHYRVRRIRLAELTALGLVLVIFSTTLLGVRQEVGRQGDISNPIEEYVVPFAPAVEGFVSEASSITAFAAVLHEIPDEFGYTYGSTYLSLLIAPIPRNIWPDKPVLSEGGITGRLIKGTVGDDGHGVPPGPAGIYYLNFGVPGVLVLSFLFGRFHRRLFTLVGHRSSAVQVIAYATILLFLREWSVESAISVSMGGFGLILVLGLTRAFSGDKAEHETGPESGGTARSAVGGRPLC